MHEGNYGLDPFLPLCPLAPQATMQLQQYKSLGLAFRAQAAEHAAVLQQVGRAALAAGRALAAAGAGAELL